MFMFTTDIIPSKEIQLLTIWDQNKYIYILKDTVSDSSCDHIKGETKPILFKMFEDLESERDII